jgi:catechol 2,3-dioxygenase-like lactoylglutathione lyase family enzyme
MEQRPSVVTLGTSDLKRARSFYEAIGRRSAGRGSRLISRGI